MDRGAPLAAIVDGQLVVDLWGGYAAAAGKRPWRRDILVNVWPAVNVWSTTKGPVALAIARL